MSNLYVRVMTGFYSHRKTAALRSSFGADAFWLPPRLWAYAAENQPDGDLSGYTSEQLAILLGCDKHACSILQALKDSGFVDSDGKIHDWEQHNGYHKKYSERARTAAEARWSKKKEPKKSNRNRKVESGDKHCLTHACSMLVAFPSINTESFKPVLESWIGYLVEKKKKPTTKTIELQLKKLAAMGEAKATACVNQSIENGWQGLFDVNTPSASTTPQLPRQSVFNLKTIIDAKTDAAMALKARWAVETGLDTTWSSQEAHEDYRKIMREVKELKGKLAQLG